MLARPQPEQCCCLQVAYCLGQRQDPAAVATLKQILRDEGEHPM